MRISDWSSDVCSSDLGRCDISILERRRTSCGPDDGDQSSREQRAKGGNVENPANYDDLIGDQSNDRDAISQRTEPAEDSSDFIFAADAAQRTIERDLGGPPTHAASRSRRSHSSITRVNPASKIGRASCRETVCPDV